ncbi:MAG: hypothetical protein BWY29_00860 [Microgenomates group bacterium ADurb.Bin238]|nr:MAG: hypothetical protein BWY29_00860 [Microgenomates group bacterium ADurb.Bin238]
MGLEGQVMQVVEVLDVGVRLSVPQLVVEVVQIHLMLFVVGVWVVEYITVVLVVMEPLRVVREEEED